MDALLQGAEIEPVVADHDQLAVEYDLIEPQLLERGQHLGEIPGHRAGATAHQLDLVAITKHERAKSVPLRLVLPPVPLGYAFARPRQHSLHGNWYRKLQ